MPLSYKYPINLSDNNAPYAVSQVRQYAPNDVIKSALPRAEKGDVIAQWLVADGYSRDTKWSKDGSKWVFVATLNTMMDATLCNNTNDAQYAMYYANQLFGDSILNARMHTAYLREALIEARDYILVHQWVESPSYFPTEVCTPLTSKEVAEGRKPYKEARDWGALRNKVFADFLKKGNIDAIPSKDEDNKDYKGPSWIDKN